MAHATHGNAARRITARRITARRTMGCSVPVDIIGQASLLQVPVDLVLALGGERRVDAVLVDLVGTAGDLLALGQRPGTQRVADVVERSEEHTSELQSLMRISYAVFCLK